MAFKIDNYTGTKINIGVAPFTQSGSIVDDTAGVGIGTVIDERSWGDIVKFFQMLMVAGGITPNNFVDSDTHGYQLMQAFLAKTALIADAEINAYDTAIVQPALLVLANDVTLTAWATLPLNTDYSQSLATAYRKDGLGRVYLKGLVVSTSMSAGLVIGTLPATYRPTQDICVTACLKHGGAPDYTVTSLLISASTGNISIRDTTIVPDNSYYFSLDGIMFFNN